MRGGSAGLIGGLGFIGGSVMPKRSRPIDWSPPHGAVRHPAGGKYCRYAPRLETLVSQCPGRPSQARTVTGTLQCHLEPVYARACERTYYTYIPDLHNRSKGYINAKSEFRSSLL